MFSLWSVSGLYSSDVDSHDGDSSESVMTSDGKGRHTSWLQRLEPGSSEEQKRLGCCEL
jgi:hypothetical protein